MERELSPREKREVRALAAASADALAEVVRKLKANEAKQRKPLRAS